MFLIRTFFWVSLIILLVPVGNNNSANVVGATKHAFSDMDHFCERNVDICNISKEAWSSLKYKAAYGLNVITTVAKDMKDSEFNKRGPEFGQQADARRSGYKYRASQYRTPQNGNHSNRKSKYTGKNAQNTLNADDMKPEWSMASR